MNIPRNTNSKQHRRCAPSGHAGDAQEFESLVAELAHPTTLPSFRLRRDLAIGDSDRRRTTDLRGMPGNTNLKWSISTSNRKEHGKSQDCGSAHAENYSQSSILSANMCDTKQIVHTGFN